MTISIYEMGSFYRTTQKLTANDGVPCNTLALRWEEELNYLVFLKSLLDTYYLHMHVCL